ncbi:MAG: hypothetical protein LBB88_11185, partial [Planctomycetaceae bacterium]|nr:hypothetical protein [Planctomycetaceae bacterium]
MFKKLFNLLSKSVKSSSVTTPIRNRKLRFESLESRELLSVSVAEFDTIRNQYADLELSANMSDYNVIEITADQLINYVNLDNAIASAKATEGVNDLIVIRTTADKNSISYSNTEIDFSATTYGSVTIVSLGEKPLEISSVEVSNKAKVGLAGLKVTGN